MNTPINKKTCALVIVLSFFAATANAHGGGGWHGGGRGGGWHGGGWHNGGWHGGGWHNGAWHGNSWSGGGWRGGGWGGTGWGGLGIGVPLGGYYYGQSCSLVRRCNSNGYCYNVRVCN